MISTFATRLCRTNALLCNRYYIVECRKASQPKPDQLRRCADAFTYIRQSSANNILRVPRDIGLFDAAYAHIGANRQDASGHPFIMVIPLRLPVIGIAQSLVYIVHNFVVLGLG